MKLSILSNTNLEPIKKFLHKKFSNLYFSPFNNILEEILNSDSKLNNFNPDIIFIHYDLNFILKDVNKFKKKLFISELNKILLGISRYKKKNIKIIISSFFLNPNNIFNSLSFEDFNFSNQTLNLMNKKINQFVKKNNNAYLLDIQNLIGKNGYDNLFDEKYIYLGKIPFNHNGFSILSNEINKLSIISENKVKKVLILDLDNTLWGGVLSEDKYILSGNDGVGLIYSEFQSKIKYLLKNGVILCICSKNNYSDVAREFRNNKNLNIKLSDFIIKKINWEKKSKNIIEISKELNLNLDSFVFLDDSKFEREEVKRNLKKVVVPEFPTNAEDINKWFNNDVVLKYFYRKEITREDKYKKKQYQANQIRNKIKNQMSYNDFLKSLKILIKVEKNNYSLLPRMVQMIQKVNQYNLTSKRYSENDVKDFFSKKNISIFTMSYKDIYNYEGITGLAIINENSKNHIEIDTFLLSCRILGRGVEKIFLKKILTHYNKKNYIYGQIIFTQKNLVCRNFFKDLKFEIIKKNKKFNCYKKKISDIKI